MKQHQQSMKKNKQFLLINFIDFSSLVEIFFFIKAKSDVFHLKKKIEIMIVIKTVHIFFSCYFKNKIFFN